MKRFLSLLSLLCAWPVSAATNGMPLSRLPLSLRAQFTAKLNACGALPQQISALAARPIPYEPGQPPVYRVEIGTTGCGAGPTAAMAEYLEAWPDSHGNYAIEDTLGGSFLSDAKGSWVRIVSGCHSSDSTQAFRWDASHKADRPVTSCLSSGGAIDWAHAHGYR